MLIDLRSYYSITLKFSTTSILPEGVIDILSSREAYKKQKEQMYELKSRTILQLHQKDIVKKIGIYHTHFSDQVVLYEVIDPRKGSSFYFSLPPSENDLFTLPTIEKTDGDFHNPTTYFCPGLQYAISFLNKNFPIKPFMNPKIDPQAAQNLLLDTTFLIEQNQELKMQRQARNEYKRPNNLKNVIVCRYLDFQKSFGPFS